MSDDKHDETAATTTTTTTTTHTCSNKSCDAEATQRCKVCEKSYYCGKECQRAHWTGADDQPAHKTSCAPDMDTLRQRCDAALERFLGTLNHDNIERLELLQSAELGKWAP